MVSRHADPRFAGVVRIGRVSTAVSAADKYGRDSLLDTGDASWPNTMMVR